MASKKSKGIRKRRPKAIARTTEVKLKDLRWADKNARVALLEDLLAQPYSNAQAIRVAAERTGVAPRTLYADLQEVYERAVPEAEEERATRVDRMRRTWQRRVRLCEERGKQSDANYALDKLCKLEGVYAPKKIELSGTVGVAIEMRAVMGILDAAGIAALELVLDQVEKAKSAGKLPLSGAPAT